MLESTSTHNGENYLQSLSLYLNGVSASVAASTSSIFEAHVLWTPLTTMLFSYRPSDISSRPLDTTHSDAVFIPTDQHEAVRSHFL